MTKHYAAEKLLQLGPLTPGEFVTITGWSRTTAYRVLQQLLDLGKIRSQNERGGKRMFFA